MFPTDWMSTYMENVLLISGLFEVYLSRSPNLTDAHDDYIHEFEELQQ